MNVPARFPGRVRLFSVVALSCAALSAFAQTFQVAGSEGDWFTAANWTGGVVPSSISSPFINNGKTAFIEAAGAAGGILRFMNVGNLTIRNGGTAAFSSIQTVFWDPNGSSTILIDGPASKLTTTGNDQFGANGGVTVVTVQNGGRYEAAEVQVAYNVGSQASLTVAGAGSSFTTSGTFSVGYFGRGEFTLADGATAVTGTAHLSQGSFSGPGTSGSVALVTGATTSWAINGTLGLGGYSSPEYYANASLTIADGATVSATERVIVGHGATLSIGSGGVAGKLVSPSILLYGDSRWTGVARPELAFNHTDDIVFTASLSGLGAITKDGTGVVTLMGANTGTHLITITDGVLRLGHVNALGTSTGTLTLAGGEIDLNGFNQGLAALNVTADSSLRFGGSGILSLFNASAINAWTGTLTLEDFVIGTNRIYVGSSIGFTATQLSQIRLAGYAAGIDGGGYLTFTAIPEPAMLPALAGASVLALALFRRRRSIRA